MTSHSVKKEDVSDDTKEYMKEETKENMEEEASEDACYQITLDCVYGELENGECPDIIDLCRRYWRRRMGARRVDVENKVSLEEDLSVSLIDEYGFAKSLDLANCRFFLGRGDALPDDMWSLQQEFVSGIGKSIWEKVIMQQA